jgi:hypothetical protein
LRGTDASPPSPSFQAGRASREDHFAAPVRGFREISPDEAPPLFASSIEEPPRRSGLSTWFAAAGSLVLGILIGFASGYRVGQGFPASTVEPAPTAAPSPAPTSGASSFSESSVSEPAWLNPPPIVPTDEAAVQPKPQTTAVPTPQQPAAAARVPSRPAPVATDPPATVPATGPGSLQVLSRPAGAQVFLDGKSVGKTPLVISDVAAGTHSVRLELPGFNRWATTVDVKGGPLRVAASLEQ